MLLYGHTYKNDYVNKSFVDIPSFENNFFLSFFGFQDMITISNNQKIEFNNIEIQCIFDKIIIKNNTGNPILFSITNNKETSINNFTKTKNSTYSHPCLFEHQVVWFIYVDADDEISFYLPTLEQDVDIKNKQIYSYPVVYDPISNKEYIIPSKTFKNISSKFVIIRSFCYLLDDIELNIENNIVAFQDGIQTNLLEKGIHRIDFYLDPDAEICFDDKILFLPEESFSVYPKTIVPNVSYYNTVYRLKLPSVYEFVKMSIDNQEIPTLRIGNYIYFNTESSINEDTIINIENERPTKILDSNILMNAFSIIDITYTIDTDTISIMGTSFEITGPNGVISYSRTTKEIILTLDFSEYDRIPELGEYFTVNTVFQQSIPLNDVIFTIIEVDSTDITKTIIKGVRHD
jgi:hypothetical protein